MHRLALFAVIGLFAVGLGGASGCGTGEGDADSAGADISASANDPCSILIVKDQKFVDLKTFLADPARKNDPIAQKVLTPLLAKGCKAGYSDIQKLDTLSSCNLETRIISERSMYENKPDVGRALASRTCGSDPTVLFLVDPIRADKDSIPVDVEMIGNNTSDGVFNYYAREPVGGPRDSFNAKDRPTDAAIWKFYGTSEDFVSNGYDCDVSKFHGACQSRYAQDNGVKGNASGVRCASCHPGGGMVQKELNAPWTYWQTDPGNYTQKHKDVYGTFQAGIAFEPVTEAQNTRWAKKRVDVLAKVSVEELLRPVFCTMDINLQAGQGSILGEFFVDSRLGDTTVTLDPKAYAAALSDAGQFVKTTPKFSSAKDDTPDSFMFPKRSDLDERYVDALIKSGKVSQDLVQSILSVDFTRPIFSPVRCSLAGLADGIKDPSKAKDELVAKLNGKKRNAAEDELLAALLLTPKQVTDEAKTFLDACTARGTSDKTGMAKDAETYAAHLRQVTRLLKVKDKVETALGQLGILDFDETVPFTNEDSKVLKDMKFDPKTCVLKDD